MMQLAIRVLLAMAAIVTFTLTVRAATPEEEREARIIASLRAVDPRAADLFTQSQAALSAGRLEDAVPLLERVIELAPQSDDAMRRLGVLHDELGHRSEAVRWCKRAVELKRSKENLIAAAFAMTHGLAPADVAPGTFEEARTLAAEATALVPTDPFALHALIRTSKALGDLKTPREALTKALAVAPDDPEVLLHSAMLRVSEGNVPRARAELARVKTLGMNGPRVHILQKALQNALDAMEK